MTLACVRSVFVAADAAKGGGGVGHGGGTAGDRERGGGWAGAHGGDAHGHSDSADWGVLAWKGEAGGLDAR